MANENEIVTDPLANEVVNDPVVNDPVTPFAIPDDAVVEVVVRGEKVLKPWKEARAGVQMQEDYTRSKQDLSKKVKELEDIHSGLTARQAAILEKETALDRILGRQPQNTPAKPGADDVITYGQFQEALREERAALTQEITTKFEEQSRASNERSTFSRWEDLTSQAVETLVKENPVLKRIPALDVVLKREAAKDNPTSERELVASLVKRGQLLAKSFEDEYVERDKAKALKKKQLIENAPVRAGGGPQFEAPKKDYMKGHRKVDFDAIARDASAALEGLEE